ncbi:hypothetical protein T458_16640 [Brevibacillus panacihumi W25]|uniref:DUF4083 domain-containing protein n=1 Tax=Brevibacillus panacihumi W25 TaxID=1408254 RepID=V6M1T9_9BACL|nr:DUF4083 family protein [Brevibacillus panacihumi]EST52596.1 hypothetical protein T458_16640 [Brevibacillus panacihumi W25]
MLEFGRVTLEWGTLLWQLIFFLLPLSLFIFVIYFLVKALAYMNAKKQMDQERNQKLDTLVRMLEQKQQRNE